MFRIIKRDFPNNEVLWEADTLQDAKETLPLVQKDYPNSAIWIEEFSYSPVFCDIHLGGDDW